MNPFIKEEPPHIQKGDHINGVLVNPETTELAVVAELKKQDIEGSKAEMIQSAFDPMVTMLKHLESDYSEIINLDITKPDTAKKAKELRLKMVKVRTGSAAIHKEQKAEYLRAGRAIDGVLNILKWAVEDKEENLAKIENYAANIEKEAKNKLFNERLALMAKVINESEAKLIPLGDLSAETFENLLNGYTMAKEQRERQEKEEQEKAIKAKAEKEAEDLRVRDELEKLKKQNEENARIQSIINSRINQITSLGFRWSEVDKSYVSEVNAMNIGLIEIKLMTTDEFNEVYSKFEKIMDAHKAKLKKLQDATELKLKNERAERKRLEDEAKQKAEQEESERKAKLAAERKLKRGPDKQKLMTFAQELEDLNKRWFQMVMHDDVAHQIHGNATTLCDKTIKYIRDNAEKL